MAISADSNSILWRTGTGSILVSRTTAAFTDVSSLPSGSAIAADKTNAIIFYGASGSSFYVSRDAGRTFSSRGTLESSYSPYKIAVHPTVAGDIWVSTEVGLFHSTNFGATFKAVSNISQAWDIALGADSSHGYPAIFTVAIVSGTGGIYRSDDAGVGLLPPWDALKQLLLDFMGQNQWCQTRFWELRLSHSRCWSHTIRPVGSPTPLTPQQAKLYCAEYILVPMDVEFGGATLNLEHFPQCVCAYCRYS